jgi:butyryl-CoA dehydrogenase
VSGHASDARAFAESVAGVLDRHGAEESELAGRLDALGWTTLAEDPELVLCAGLAAVELGRRLGPLREVDRLLGAAPMAGALVRSLGGDELALPSLDGALTPRRVVRSETVRGPEGLELRRVLEFGAQVRRDPAAGEFARQAWTAALVGYLGGLGQGALALTTDYVRQRRAFGSTLGGLAPVQQLLAEAATLVRGVTLLAANAPGANALLHAGSAVAEACAACHQATGAIGFTLEYPLHRFTQRARALATWNDTLLEALIQTPAMAR